MNAPPFRKRLIGISLGIFALFSLLIIQFYRIQIVEGDRWRKLAERQHKLVVKEPFHRGLFYSNGSLREGHPQQDLPLVQNIAKFHLYIDPLSIPISHQRIIIEQLKKFLPQPKAFLEGAFLKRSRCRKIASWIDREFKESIETWWFPYAKQQRLPRNALYFIQDYQRCYPFGKLLGCALHTIREDREKGTDRHIPTGGLELVFDRYLQGKMGKREMIRSPRQPLEDEGRIIPPDHGADVYLTIDATVQAIVEEEIEKAVQAAEAKGGWAVMMDPKSGEIWALAQYPSFDPRCYRDYFNDPLLQPYTNVKAITEPYEPGSIFKPITLSVALLANQVLKEKGEPPLFSPYEKIATATCVLPGRKKPIKDLHPHRYLNMYLGLQKSSNVYMSKLIQRVVERMGAEWYSSVLQQIFGFGKKTGIELPSESLGMVPVPGKKYASGHLQWSSSTPYSLAMGHNILASSLQMLRAYAILANGGWDVKPTFVRRIVKKDSLGKTSILLDRMQGEKAPVRLLHPEIVSEVVKAMKFATKRGGTASRAEIWGYTEAGKTGTSEKIVGGVYSKTHHISTFIGFAPVTNPRFVLLIAIDEPVFKYIPGKGKMQHAGMCAAPAFQAIGTRTLHYLGVEPDDPFGYPPGDPRSNPQKADWFLEVEKLKRLYQEWNSDAA
jgi:cell division protein FtsI (penicillin-binding protein 3)